MVGIKFIFDSVSDSWFGTFCQFNNANKADDVVNFVDDKTVRIFSNSSFLNNFVINLDPGTRQKKIKKKPHNNTFFHIKPRDSFLLFRHWIKLKIIFSIRNHCSFFRSQWQPRKPHIFLFRRYKQALEFSKKFHTVSNDKIQMCVFDSHWRDSQIHSFVIDWIRYFG